MASGAMVRSAQHYVGSMSKSPKTGSPRDGTSRLRQRTSLRAPTGSEGRAAKLFQTVL
jgi:hypothetical protein